ncbi:MAG: hypothetical protein AAGB00_05420 [Planctomycetota bacterium]
MPRPLREFVVCLALALPALFALPAPGMAAPGLLERFEAPETAWRQPANPGAATVLEHARVRTDYRGQSAGAERLRFACPAGYSGVFLYPIGRAPVIEDSRYRVVYRGTAAGAKLAVRVVFPRSQAGNAKIEDSQAANRLTTVVRASDAYEQVGEWAELELSDLPLLVKRQARLLRASGSKTPIDERGAYVDSVVLIVPGGPSGSEFWVENLTVDGALVGPEAGAASAARAGSAPGEASVLVGVRRQAEAPADINSGSPPVTGPADAQVGPLETIRISAAGFAVGETPFLPRVCSHRGEAPELLARLGFNTLASKDPPGPSLAAEANKHGLRLIVPPPTEGADPGDALQAVLGWMVAAGVDAGHIDSVRPTLSRLRDDARLSTRPLLSMPEGGLPAWGRLTDGLVLPAGPATPLAPAPFAAATSQALPGAAALAKIELTHKRTARDQFRAFAPAGKAAEWRSPRDVEAAVWRAFAAGASGVWFTTGKPLGGAGPDDEAVAAALELINLKIDLLEPWLLSGESIGRVLHADRSTVGAIYQRGRTKVVVGLANASSKPASGAGEVVAPGVAETARAYRLSPAGLTPVRSRRTLGGVAVDADAVRLGHFLLLTDDRRAVRDIRARAARVAKKAVQLQQARLLAELTRAEAVLSKTLRPPGDQPSRADGPAAAAKRKMSQSKAAQSSGNLAGAYDAAGDGLALLVRAHAELRLRLAHADQLDSSPLLARARTWPDEVRLRQLLRALPRSTNLLAGGDFEDLGALRSAGWRHTRLGDRPEPLATVALSADAPAHGEKYLALTGRPSAGRLPPPSVWVTSPPTPLLAGQLIEITGWVRFHADGDAPGSIAVVDSLGGEELAIAVRQTSDWRPFRLLRRPTENGSLRVSFVFSGAGSAGVDAVMVRPIPLATPERRETANNPAAGGRRSNDTAHRKRDAVDAGLPGYRK